MLVEVGCAAGHTTIFLSRHLYMSKYRGQYYAYDTFRGFAHDDQQSELAAGRIGSTKQCDFSLNDRRWVQWAIDQNVRMAKTKLVEVDAAKHDFSELNATVAFVLLERLQRIRSHLMGHMCVLGRSGAPRDVAHRASAATPSKTLRCPTRGPRPLKPWPRSAPLPMHKHRHAARA